MRFVRVTSKEQDPNGELGPVVLDLRVDDAGNPVVNGRVFGAMGGHRGDFYWPFTMHPKGKVDFGSGGCGQGCLERNDRFNILERNIRVGVFWTYHNTPGGGDFIYRITAVDPLG